MTFNDHYALYNIIRVLFGARYCGNRFEERRMVDFFCYSSENVNELLTAVQCTLVYAAFC